MDDALLARLDALEAEVADLRSQLRDKENQDPAPARTNGLALSRRLLLGSGGALAAGAVLANPSPASAQAGPPASDVTFAPPPTGLLQATDVQAALVELDGEKAPIAMLDIRTLGAKRSTEDANFDNRLVIQSAIDWLAASGGGTVLIPNGKFNFTGEITVKPGVDLWGSGGHGQGVGSGGTVLRATVDGARVVFQGVGGQSGNFVVDGNRKNPGGEGLVCIGGDYPANDPRTVAVRQFTTFRVAGSATNGLVLLGVQNCSFTQCISFDHIGNALILDTHSRSSAFTRCDFGNSGGNNILIRQSTRTNLPAVPPTNHVFIRCAMERGYFPTNGSNNAQMLVTHGWENYFYNCGFTFGSAVAPVSGALVKIEGGWVGFQHCDFYTDAATQPDTFAVHTTIADGFHLIGSNTFSTVKGIRYDPPGAGEASIQGRPEFTSKVTTRWAGNAAYKFLANTDSRQRDIHVDATDNNYLIRGRQRGEGGIRWQIATDGTIGVANGTAWAPQATWKLLADASGWETPNNVKVNGNLTANSRLTVQQVTAAPAPPPSGQAVLFVKGGNLVVGFNNGTSTRYKWLNIMGTGSQTWTDGTAPP